MPWCAATAARCTWRARSAGRWSRSSATPRRSAGVLLAARIGCCGRRAAPSPTSSPERSPTRSRHCSPGARPRRPTRTDKMLHMRPATISTRRLLAFAHDVTAAGIAWLAAFWLRFNLEIPADYLHSALVTLPGVVAANTLLFWGLGLYRGLWRYASLPDLQRILFAVGAAAIIAIPTAVLAAPMPRVPHSVYMLAPLLLVGMMSGSRLLYRAWKEGRLAGVERNPEAKPVVV